MRCVVLREGSGEPLFLFPGLGGEVGEFTRVVDAMRTPRPIVGIQAIGDLPGSTPDWHEGESRQIPTMEAMAAAAVAIVRGVQPSGPYFLGGYSFGGIVALEVAQTLQSAGDDVRFVGLIDALYDRRYWPLGLFVRATLRRSAGHISRLVRHPSRESWSELRTRSRRLVHRIAARTGRSDAARTGTSAGSDASVRNLEVMAGWRPRPVEGPVVMFTSDGDDDFACEPAKLWQPWIRHLDIQHVPGSHRSLMADGESVATLAKAMDDAVARAAERPLRVLLATTFAWDSAYPLARELSAAGCTVEAVGPPKSGLHHLTCVSRSYRLSLVRPLMTLRKAVESSTADLVIPLDDRTRQSLQEIYVRADPSTIDGGRLRRRIRYSLGPAENFAHVYSRAATMGLAAEHGVRCPETTSVGSVEDVRRWMAEHNASAVMKTDGSWGGREVVVVRTADEAAQTFKLLNRFPRWKQIAKRWIVEGDPWPLRMRLRGRRPAISIQAFVEGRPANVAAACFEGRLLGAVQAEALSCAYPLGPSSVVRVIEHAEMHATAGTMVRALGLTGLCGFDFVLEAGTQHAHLVEVNPRATPTAYLITADGADLLSTLRRALGRSGPPDRPRRYPDGIVDLSLNVPKPESPSPSVLAALIARAFAVVLVVMAGIGWSPGSETPTPAEESSKTHPHK